LPDAVPPAGQPPAILTPMAALDLAVKEIEAGRLGAAARLCHSVLASDPNHAGALHMLGVVMQKKGRPALGIELVKQAILQDGSVVLYHRNLCEMYRLEHRLDEAIEEGKRTLALKPDDALAHHFLGMVHFERCELDEAIRYARRALEIDPNHPGSHFELAEALLLRGDLVEGFVEYEWRHQLKSVAPLLSPRPLQPLWDGTPVKPGALLLVADQGFGDVIQFSRYIPIVAERSPGFVVACNPEVKPILLQQNGIERIIIAPQGLPAFAYWSPLSTLPMVLGTELATIPASIPYIRADPAKTRRWGERIAAAVPPGHLRVGIVWAGRPTHGNDRNRSATLKAFAPLAALDRVTLVSLQMGPPQTQIDAYAGTAPLVDLGREIGDFTDTFGILENIDLVISVDTSIVHLAGAMGRPVWTLLPFSPDWRWLLGREDSPWYPTMVLLRQPAPGRWDAVLENAARRLQAMTPGA
jgi:Tetratricopeptide repeat